MANKSGFDRRKERVRRSLKVKATGRPRLCVFRSGKNIHAQVIDDVQGHTIAAASSLEKDFRSDNPNGSTTAAATAVGKLVGERAVAKGVAEVVFDRGGYIYHGRVRSLADGAREAGLKF